MFWPHTFCTLDNLGDSLDESPFKAQCSIIDDLKKNIYNFDWFFGVQKIKRREKDYEKKKLSLLLDVSSLKTSKEGRKMEKFKAILENGKIKDPHRFVIFLSYNFGVGVIINVGVEEINQFQILRADEKKMEEIKEWFEERGIELKYKKI